METALADAFLVMALGMTGVFLFLVLVVVVMEVIARLAPVIAVPVIVAPVVGAAATDHALIAVLQAAVVAYESDCPPNVERQIP